MPIRPSLREFLVASHLRSAELATATVLLTTAALFLGFATGDAHSTVDPTSGILSISAVASILLPVIVVAHAGYDLVAWLRTSRTHAGQRSLARMLVLVLRVVELVLAVLLVAIFGFYAFLVTTQSGGEGAGAIVVGMVLLVAIASSLLSITVLAHGLVDYTRFYAA